MYLYISYFLVELGLIAVLELPVVAKAGDCSLRYVGLLCGFSCFDCLASSMQASEAVARGLSSCNLWALLAQ